MATTPGPAPEVVWRKASNLLRRHPSFAPLVERAGPVRLRPSEPDPFAALVRSIIYQQLAGRAAATIHGRLQACLDGPVTPQRVLAADDDLLRGAGLSRGKLRAIRDLAHRTGTGALNLAELPGLPDREVVSVLSRVHGIGPWTAQMHLIFHLRRPDVWPVGDLGVRSGWARIHGLVTAPDARTLEPLGEDFRPWRSAAAWYCWQAMRPDVASDLFPEAGT